MRREVHPAPLEGQNLAVGPPAGEVGEPHHRAERGQDQLHVLGREESGPGILRVSCHDGGFGGGWETPGPDGQVERPPQGGQVVVDGGPRIALLQHLALVARDAVGCDAERPGAAERAAQPRETLLQRGARAVAGHHVVIADHRGELLERHALGIGRGGEMTLDVL